MNINAIKRGIIKNLKKMVAPHLWPSGYVDGTEPDKKFRLLAFVAHAGDRGRRIAHRVYSEDLTSVEGFYKDGIITDATAGGMVTAGFDNYCLEDLMSLEKWMNKHFHKELARIQQNKNKENT